MTSVSVQPRIPAPSTRPQPSKKCIAVITLEKEATTESQILKNGLSPKLVRGGVITLEAVYSSGQIIGRRVVARHPENGSEARLVFSNHGAFLCYVYEKPDGVIYLESGASNAQTRSSQPLLHS